MATPKWDGKRWRLRVSIDGHVRCFQSTTPGKKGKQEVERLAAERSRLTDLVDFEAAYHRFLCEVQAMTGPDNYVNLESIGRNYLLPKFGSRKLVDIRLGEYQELLYTVKKKDGSPMAKKSISNIRGALVSFSRFCVRSGIMTESLAELRVPKTAVKKGKTILQPDQARRLMTEFNDDWYINMWRWLMCTGMRPGEAIGLKWSDIRDGIVHIERSRNYRGRDTEGKNENAKRTFALNSILAKILDDQRAKTWRLRSEFVFCDHAGKQSIQTTTKNSYERISREIAPGTSPYCLRHTFISFMAQALPEQALKSIVGHSVNMDTYGVYGHKVVGSDQVVADQVGITLVKTFDD